MSTSNNNNVKSMVEDAVSSRLDPIAEKIDKIDASVARIEVKVDRILDLLEKQKRMIRKMDREFSSKHENLRSELSSGFLRSQKRIDRRLDRLDEEMKHVKHSVNKVVKYLEESDIEIKATASDFEGLLSNLGIKTLEGEEPGFEHNDYDGILPVDEFMASNVYRLIENRGASLKNKAIKRVLSGLNESGDYNVLNIASVIRNMPPKDLELLKESRDISLNEMIKRTTLSLKKEVHEAIYSGKTNSPLTSGELKKIYKKMVDSVAKDGWQDPSMGDSRAQKIVQNAMIKLFENKAHFMSYNKRHFEAEIQDIANAMEQDRDRFADAQRPGIKKSLMDFGRELSKGRQKNLEYDPNSMDSLISAKNLAYGIRAYSTFFIYNNASKMFGKDLADEMREMASKMRTRQGIIDSLLEYVSDESEKGSKSIPHPDVVDQMKAFKSTMRSQWSSDSFEAKMILRVAFDVAKAKVDSEFSQHLPGWIPEEELEPSPKERAIAEQIIAAACVMGHKPAQQYINGELDPKREDVRRSYIHRLEKNGGLEKLFKQITPKLTRSAQTPNRDGSLGI